MLKASLNGRQCYRNANTDEKMHYKINGASCITWVLNTSTYGYCVRLFEMDPRAFLSIYLQMKFWKLPSPARCSFGLIMRFFNVLLFRFVFVKFRSFCDSKNSSKLIREEKVNTFWLTQSSRIHFCFSALHYSNEKCMKIFYYIFFKTIETCVHKKNGASRWKLFRRHLFKIGSAPVLKLVRKYQPRC